MVTEILGSTNEPKPSTNIQEDWHSFTHNCYRSELASWLRSGSWVSWSLVQTQQFIGDSVTWGSLSEGMWFCSMSEPWKKERFTSDRPGHGQMPLSNLGVAGLFSVTISRTKFFSIVDSLWRCPIGYITLHNEPRILYEPWTCKKISYWILHLRIPWSK